MAMRREFFGGFDRVGTAVGDEDGDFDVFEVLEVAVCHRRVKAGIFSARR